MILSELKRLDAILQWARGKTYSAQVLNEIVSIQEVVKREIRLKTIDPRKSDEGDK